jgi:hypothetical protein
MPTTARLAVSNYRRLLVYLLYSISNLKIILLLNILKGLTKTKDSMLYL